MTGMNKVLALFLVALFFSSSLVIITPAFGTAIAGDYWVTKAPIPVAVFGMGVTAIDNKIYVVGGASFSSPFHNATYQWNIPDATYQYDPATNMWTSKAPMPTARTELAAITYQNKVYAIGGTVFPNINTSYQCNVTEVYDPVANNWTTAASMPVALNWVSANTVGDKVYVFGSTSNQTLMLIYDPLADNWTTKSVSVPLCSPSVTIGERIYFPSTKMEIYDTKTGNWSVGEDSPVPIFYNGEAAATTGEFAPISMCVFGVNDWAQQGPMPNRIYYPKNDSWSSGAEVPSNKQGFGVAVLNDTFYIIGGQALTFPFPDPSYSVLTPSAAVLQYFPADYGTPDPDYQSPTPQPTQTPTINSKPAIIQTEFIVTAGVVAAIVAIAGVVILRLKRQSISKAISNPSR